MARSFFHLCVRMCEHVSKRCVCTSCILYPLIRRCSSDVTAHYDLYMRRSNSTSQPHLPHFFFLFWRSGRDLGGLILAQCWFAFSFITSRVVRFSACALFVAVLHRALHLGHFSSQFSSVFHTWEKTLSLHCSLLSASTQSLYRFCVSLVDYTSASVTFDSNSEICCDFAVAVEAEKPEVIFYTPPSARNAKKALQPAVNHPPSVVSVL